ncbi:hypothetical protein OS493_024296 [Desmophyllum pertusum]|uniref:Uncharacterized protein n=1 Tax=Desmophyllum pertusum TaxID=174260 RepID=A0A9W9Z1Q4_9CNID|nr:hypothetical protein OS493_024296 [Desmophyllum pertusum]
MLVIRDALAEASPRTDTTQHNAEENSAQMESSTEEQVMVDKDTCQPDVDMDDQMEVMETITELEEYTGSSCTNCSALKDENRQLRNQVKSLQGKLKDKGKVLRKTQSQGEYLSSGR